MYTDTIYFSLITVGTYTIRGPRVINNAIDAALAAGYRSFGELYYRNLDLYLVTKIFSGICEKHYVGYFVVEGISQKWAWCFAPTVTTAKKFQFLFFPT